MKRWNEHYVNQKAFEETHTNQTGWLLLFSECHRDVLVKVDLQEYGCWCNVLTIWNSDIVEEHNNPHMIAVVFFGTGDAQLLEDGRRAVQILGQSRSGESRQGLASQGS